MFTMRFVQVAVTVLLCVNQLISTSFAACCCESNGTGLYEVVWCVNAITFAYWPGVPVDESYGECSNWVGAGPDYYTTTLSAFNSELGTEYNSCFEVYGNETTDTCNVAQQYYGPHALCLTPEEADARADDTQINDIVINDDATILSGVQCSVLGLSLGLFALNVS